MCVCVCVCESVMNCMFASESMIEVCVHIQCT